MDGQMNKRLIEHNSTKMDKADLEASFKVLSTAYKKTTNDQLKKEDKNNKKALSKMTTICVLLCQELIIAAFGWHAEYDRKQLQYGV